jgi:hypothetical protein
VRAEMKFFFVLDGFSAGDTKSGDRVAVDRGQALLLEAMAV